MGLAFLFILPEGSRVPDDKLDKKCKQVTKTNGNLFEKKFGIVKYYTYICISCGRTY